MPPRRIYFSGFSLLVLASFRSLTDLLPRETALKQIREVRADHQAQLEFFLARQAALTEQQLGPLLVTRRGVLAEQAYVAWCDEVAEMIERRPA